MTDWIWKEAMLDTDFALKLEKIQRFNAIEKYLSQLVNHVFIHRYIYDNEILMPKRTKNQIDILIAKGKATIVEAETLKAEDNQKLIIYQQTIGHLENVDSETRQGGKNWGEIVSVSYAFAKGIPFILSDERELQKMIDDKLNSQTVNDIHVIRLWDFITGMREKGLPRKEAYAIWCIAHQDNRQWAKDVFQKEIWPIK